MNISRIQKRNTSQKEHHSFMRRFPSVQHRPSDHHVPVLGHVRGSGAECNHED